ncbi:LysR family transcriptional regulator [Symbioplanes lichenis]|uniref:LysR substrate-binding domain-containing protein n=1 Tax=Symbioplanes lichenis TaxID=1629072 RepID=UPI0027399AAE|nr:LysR family transcriptional regulator [Actinoplanes lichenis]
MDVRQLTSFTVLAQELHFGRAAARLHLAQPALSQQIRQLEKELGSTLFLRSTRRVELTEAGELLLGRARAVLALLDRAADEQARLAQGRLGTVGIGFIGTATYDVLPGVARRLRTTLPDLRLDLRGEMLTPELVAGVLDFSLDVALMRPPMDPTGLRLLPLRTEPLVAALRADDPRAAGAAPPGRADDVRAAGAAPPGRADDPRADNQRADDPRARDPNAGDPRTVSAAPRGRGVEGRPDPGHAGGGLDLRSLADEPFIAHPSRRKSSMHQSMLDACHAAGFEPREIIEVRETSTLVTFVAAGLGVALVPASVRSLGIDGVAYVPLTGVAPTVELVMATREGDTSPGVRRVADVIEEYVRAAA